MLLKVSSLFVIRKPCFLILCCVRFIRQSRNRQLLKQWKPNFELKRVNCAAPNAKFAKTHTQTVGPLKHRRQTKAISEHDSGRRNSAQTHQEKGKTRDRNAFFDATKYVERLNNSEHLFQTFCNKRLNEFPTQFPL